MKRLLGAVLVAVIVLLVVVLAVWGPGLGIPVAVLGLLAVFSLPAVGFLVLVFVLGVTFVRSLAAPRGSALGMPAAVSPMSTTVPRPTWRWLFCGMLSVILLLPIWAAPRFGVEPMFVAQFEALIVVILGFMLLVPMMRVSVESSTVSPGTPEQLFELASDIKLSLQVVPNRRRRLLSVTGQPGQPGSSFVTAGFGGVRMTTVVSSEPPRKLVTTTATSPFPVWRFDIERTYTPVAEGTLLQTRVRERIPLFAWLLRPLFKRRARGQAAIANARVTDYLEAVATKAGDV